MIGYFDFGATFVLTNTVLGIACFFLWKKQHSQSNYPPGPFSFPILGNIPQMAWSGSMQSFLKQSRKRFGNIFTIEFGGTKQVVVSGYDNIYNIIIRNAVYSSNRSTLGMPHGIEKLARETPGVVWAPFPQWKTFRSFSLNVLLNEGSGFLEEAVLKEIEEFCQHFIEPELGNSIELSKSFPKAASNIISELIFRGRCDYDDSLSTEMVEAVRTSIQSWVTGCLLKNIPLIKYFKVSGAIDQEQADGFLRAEMHTTLEKHKATFDRNNPENIFDEFLIQKEKQRPDDTCFTDGNAISLALELYGAGIETTAIALRWALLYTCLHPEVQSKVKQELDDVIGCDQVIKYSDRNALPYTSAVLLETLRLANIAFASLPHTLDKEMVVDGQKIHAGSILMLNMASVMHDDEVFDNPETFDPERYLTGDIQLKKQRTIPFGLGRRVCLGEILARMELFLFYASLMQKYDVRFPAGKTYCASPIIGINNSPQLYHIVFTKRC